MTGSFWLVAAGYAALAAVHGWPGALAGATHLGLLALFIGRGKR